MYYGYHSRPLKNKIRTNRSWAVSRMVVASLGRQGQLHYRLVCLTKVGVVATHPTYTLCYLFGVKGQEFLIQVIVDALLHIHENANSRHPSVATV